MRLFLQFFVLIIFLFSISCAGNQREAMPLDTLMAYTTAIKKKDTTTMKLLLSDASLKMAEQQARQQNVTVDDIVKNETLFGENQKQLLYRNQKIEGDRATIEVKNASESWDVVPFVREENVWKLDKQGIATQMQQQNEVDLKKLDEMINSDPLSNPNPANTQPPEMIYPTNQNDLIAPNNSTTEKRVQP